MASTTGSTITIKFQKGVYAFQREMTLEMYLHLLKENPKPLIDDIQKIRADIDRMPESHSGNCRCSCCYAHHKYDLPPTVDPIII
ncbi:hypothetical protein MA9V2_006 [Chryseobacterium phage MA9V-2]|nr:hypothetical protein MA9V2_006 [Chryseobacterium phage MA9V-2]